MLFNSFDFAIFFPIFFVLFWTVHKKKILRNVLLLVSSYIFYGWWDWRFLFLIVFSSVIDFIVGGFIYRENNSKRRKAFLLISLLTNLGLLAYFKYVNFFIDSFVSSFNFFGGSLESFSLNVILPVGISFYTFQTLSYTIDIYRGRIKPIKSPLSFFTFVAFFPQLVAGPIERASHLLPQFERVYEFNYYRIKNGFLLIAFGLFKKMVIADRVAIVVNQVYTDPNAYNGFELIIATIFFAFQIYCDFSGYSDIAIGISRTLGFDLMKNFDSPYFSKSITEFWRRWHISLSTWFRDYVYIPLGGSRKGKYRTYANLFIVFIVSGLWHGAAITFIFWGAIHGFFIVLEKMFSRSREKVFKPLGLWNNSIISHLIFAPITFVIVCFGWIFFRANSISDAIRIVECSFYISDTSGLKNRIYELGLISSEFNAAIIFIILLIGFEILQRKFGMTKVLERLPTLVRWTFYLIVIFVLIIFGMYGGDVPKEFIYFQF